MMTSSTYQPSTCAAAKTRHIVKLDPDLLPGKRGQIELLEKERSKCEGETSARMACEDGSHRTDPDGNGSSVSIGGGCSVSRKCLKDNSRLSELE